MDWREEYKRKLVLPEEAVKIIKSGDYVVIPTGREPHALGLAIVARRNELQGVKVLVSTIGRDFGWYDSGWEDSFTILTRYVSPKGIGREWADERRGDYLFAPSGLYTKGENERPAEVPSPDVTLIEVSPPDKHGFCSFGASLWDKKEQALRAKAVIAEVNSHLIRTYGDNFIHVSQIDYFVEHISAGKKWREETFEPTQLSKEIAPYVSSLVNDNDTIQIGLGSITFSLVAAGAFNEKSDLGMHIESLPPQTSRLIKQGVVTCKYKTLHTGKVICTAAGGPREDLEFYNENPMIEIYSSSYVNNIKVIAAHDNMVAINQTLTVDLTGQAASEGLGTRMYSGTGGQIDFVIGACLSRGGRSILVLPSTTKDGKLSRIVPLLPQGTPVTIIRQFADYVVTEFGIARLWGKTLRERSAELISVAHPDFRAELRKETKRLFYP